MPLEAFIEHHTYSSVDPTTIQLMERNLSPLLGRRSRQHALRFEDVRLRGRIGTYQISTSAIPTAEPYYTDCSAIKPFATLTSRIEHEFKWRESQPPDDLLKRLGRPFRAGTKWIELVYRAADVPDTAVRDKKPFIAIPTRIESAGHWAYWPDRDTLSNFALDLATDGQGFPEVIHRPVDAKQLLRDAIVWPLPTRADWSQPNSPFHGP